MHGGIANIRLLMVVVAMLLLAFTVSVGLGVLVGDRVFDKARESTGIESNVYVTVIPFNESLEFMTAQSTRGEVTIPIKGKVNVVVPQYVLCPDVCHWETSIMLYAFTRILEDGFEDKVVFVTISVDPWMETIDDAREYQESTAGEYLRRGIEWYWIHDSLEVMERLWEEYNIVVVLDNETNTVTHTAGFYIIAPDGTLTYFISPTSQGWIQGQKEVAETLYRVIRELAE